MQNKTTQNSDFIPLGLIYARIVKDVENMNVKILPEA